MTITTASWAGAAGNPSGSWGTASNWSPALVPTSSTAVTISLAGYYGVTIDAAAAAYSINLDLPNAQSFLADSASLAIAGTLTVTAGIFYLYGGGVVAGGVLSTGSQGHFSYQGGTFQGVAYAGTLDLSGVGANLNVSNGIKLEAASGAGAGAVLLTGYGASLTIDNSTTLSNATITAGSNQGSANLALRDTKGGHQTLTLGASLKLIQTGAEFSLYTGAYATDSVVNKGAITLAAAGGSTSISGNGAFINSGSITLKSGSYVSLQGKLANSGSITIAAGAQFYVQGAVTNTGTMTVGDDGTQFQSALTNNGTITLTGRDEFYAAVAGHGTIDAGSQTNFDGSVASTETVALTGANELLNITGGFAATIANLGLGDVFILNGSATAAAISGGNLVISETGGKSLTLKLTNTSLTSSTPVTVVSFGGQSFISIGGAAYRLAAGATIAGNAYNNAITTTAAALASSDNVNAGTGSFNVLQLQGAGTFDLALPATLGGIDYILAYTGQAASGGIAATVQTIDTRSGMTATLNVQDGAKNSANPNAMVIDINGGNDSVRFEMNDSHGQNSIKLGSAKEVVKGSTAATELTNVTASTAAIAGADAQGRDNNASYATAGETILNIKAGGAIALNASDQDLTVKLGAASVLTLGSGSFIIAVGSAGNDTITAGGQNQVLIGGGGTNTLIGSNAFGDVFADTSAHLGGDSIKNFGHAGNAQDLINATDMTYVSGMTATYTQGSGQGTLSFGNGTVTASVTLIGTYNPADFVVKSIAGASGTFVAYTG